MGSWHRENPELIGADADPWMIHESYRKALPPVCPQCEGSGEIHFMHRPPDPQTEDSMRCGRCHGDGVLS